MKVAPKIVSGRVEKTSIESSEFSTENLIIAPLDFPIQFLCISFNGSGQSIFSNPLNNLSEYSEILILHCLIFFLTTSYPPL